MIPSLTELAQKFGVSAALVPVGLAGLFTLFVMLVQSIARLFHDRKS